MDIKRGIVLLAIGNPAYGNFAFNLAVTLKEYSPNIPIQLIYEEHAISHLDEWKRSFFDWKTVIEKEDCRYTDGKLFPAKAKLKLYEYSAFENSIYLDVDGLAIKDFTPLFEQCEAAGGFYYSQMSGLHEIKDADNDFNDLQWARVKDIISHYGLKTGDIIPAINSSFQYFRMCRETKDLFNLALSLIENPIPLHLHPQKWGKANMQPDELYMDVALAKIKLIPELPGLPQIIYFNTKRGKELTALKESFYMIGLYGGLGFSHQSILSMYDKILQEIFRLKGYGTHTFKIYNLMRQKIS